MNALSMELRARPSFGRRKRQRTAAVQDARASSQAQVQSWFCVRGQPRCNVQLFLPLSRPQDMDGLAKGQRWQTGAADIGILGIGNGFIHYTVTQRWARGQTTAQISGLEPMRHYLRRHGAQLVGWGR